MLDFYPECFKMFGGNTKYNVEYFPMISETAKLSKDTPVLEFLRWSHKVFSVRKLIFSALTSQMGDFINCTVQFMLMFLLFHHLKII